MIVLSIRFPPGYCIALFACRLDRIRFQTGASLLVGFCIRVAFLLGLCHADVDHKCLGDGDSGSLRISGYERDGYDELGTYGEVPYF